MTSDLLNKIKNLEKENDELKIQNLCLKKRLFGLKQTIASMKKMLRKEKINYEQNYSDGQNCQRP